MRLPLLVGAGKVASALIAHTIAGSAAGGNITTPTIDTTGATLLVAAVSWYNGIRSTLSDSKGNTWVALTPKEGLSGTRLFSVVAPVVGSGHTFTTVQSGTDYPAIAVAAFSGTAGVAADLDTGALVTAATVQPGTGTPAHNGEIIVTAQAGPNPSNSETLSIDSGFAITDQLTNNTNCISLALAWLKQGTAGAINPTWTGPGGSGVRAAVMGSWQ